MRRCYALSEKASSIFFLLLTLLFYSQLLVAAPVITGTSSFRGQPGDVITITGSGFSTDPAENEVRFGPNRAPVRDATATSLTVQVPNAQPVAFTQLTVTDPDGAISNPRFYIVFRSSKISVAVCPLCCQAVDMIENNTSARPSDPMHRAGDQGLYTALGDFYKHNSDYFLQGRTGSGAQPMLHYTFRRINRTQLNTDSLIGHNWQHNYFENLTVKADGSVVHDNGLGREDLYRKNNVGEFVAPPELFTELVQETNGTFELHYRGGTIKTFDTDGKLLEYRDRNENRMTFHYEDLVFPRRLTRVNDTLGRDIDYSYLAAGDNAGRLEKISDYIGREVKFSYDDKGNLIEVTSPTVNETPNGNDFLQGKTTRYTYSSGFSDERLNHNLLTITRPNEVTTGGDPVLINKYGTSPGSFEFDKLIEQTFGGTNASQVPAGGTFTYSYTQLNAGVRSDNPNLAVILIRETDRNGNVEEFEYNRLLYPVLRREFTKGLRTGEPAVFETRMAYNADVMLTEKTFPEGNRVEYIYDEANPNRLAQGNLLTANRLPDAIRGGDQAFLTTTYTYEPRFNQIKTMTDPRGNDPDFTPPNGGPTSPARYTTTHTFDYEVVGDPLLNPEGFTNGNIVRKQEPTVTLLDDSPQAIITEFTYNRFGQKKSEIDPEGNVDKFFFFSENDPDGDGDTSPGTRPGLATDTGGYLKERIIDSTTSPRRTEPTPPVQIRNRFHYDPVGNIIQTFDGRNIRTDFFVNELDQVVQTKRAADVSETVSANPPEPLPLTAFAYVQNTFFDFNDNVIQHQTEDRGDTSNTGGFVDFTFEFDILDNVILESQEVDTNTELTTRFRYDANENPVMTILPANNANSAVFDERDLLFESTRGTAGFDRPGGAGTVPSTTTYNYDRNRNLIETVDAEPNGGTPSSIAGVGDKTEMTFDGFDRSKTATDPLGNRITTFYDPASNIIRNISDGDPIDDVAGDSGNKTLATTEFVHDELSRVFVTHQLLFQTPDAAPIRTPVLTDTPAMDAIAVYLADAPSDTANVPGSTGIAVIGRISTLTGFDRLSRTVFAVQDDQDAYVSEYDGADRVVSTIDSALDNGFSGGSFDFNSVAGNSVETAYDDNNNPIEREEIDVGFNESDETFCTTYHYDALDRLQSVRDNIGQAEDYRYDSRNNLVAKADAVNDDGSRAFPRRGLCEPAVATANQFGNVTRTFFDGINRTVQTEVFLTPEGIGNNTYIGADIFGVKIDPPGGYVDPNQSKDGRIVVDNAFDQNSQLLALRDDDGNTSAFIFDNQNRTIVERKGMNAGFQGIDFTITGGDSGMFNETSIPPAKQDPPVETEQANTDNGTSIEFTFDRDSNVEAMVNEGDVNGVRSILRSTFDALNRRTRLDIENPAGSLFTGTTLQRFEFDGLSRMTLSFDDNQPGNNDDDVTVGFFYDSLSRKVEETQQIGGLSAKAVSTDYNIETGEAVAQGTSLIYPDGRSVVSTFDNLDRLEDRTDVVAGDVDAIGTFAYIGKFRVTTLTYQNGTFLRNSYDDLRRIVNRRWERVSNGSVIVGFEHQDSSGNPLYDRANNKRIEFKTHDSDNSEQYKYDSLYRLASPAAGLGVEDESAFERGIFTDSSRNSMAGGVVFHQDWNLDGLGNWTLLDDDGVQEPRTHSDFNEIFGRERVNTDGGINERSHDKNGNMLDTGFKENGGETFPGGGLRIEYDALNRVRRVFDNGIAPGVDATGDDEIVGEYSYDSANRRFRKEVFNGGVVDDSGLDGTTDFYYEGWRVVEERDSGDAVVQQYVFGNYLDEVLVLDDRGGGNVSVADLNNGAGGDRHFYHSNTLYHIYALTDETDAIAEAVREYDAYGKVSGLFIGPGGDGDWFTGDDVLAGNPNVSGVGNPWFYTGQRLDAETGLMYYKNRYYSPDLGRFLARDLVGYQSGTLLLYKYAAGNVTNAVDPYGLRVKCLTTSYSIYLLIGFTFEVARCDDDCGNWGVYWYPGLGLGVDAGVSYKIKWSSEECLAKNFKFGVELAGHIGPVTGNVSAAAPISLQGQLTVAGGAGGHVGVIPVGARVTTFVGIPIDGDWTYTCPCPPKPLRKPCGAGACDCYCKDYMMEVRSADPSKDRVRFGVVDNSRDCSKRCIRRGFERYRCVYTHDPNPSTGPEWGWTQY